MWIYIATYQLQFHYITWLCRFSRKMRCLMRHQLNCLLHTTGARDVLNSRNFRLATNYFIPCQQYSVSEKTSISVGLLYVHLLFYVRQQFQCELTLFKFLFTNVMGLHSQYLRSIWFKFYDVHNCTCNLHALCISGSFSWDEYLREQGGEPAPQRCFKQVCM